VDPVVSRQCWRATEPVHACTYFAPEPQEEYAALGYDVTGPGAGYFVPRSAPLGAVRAPVVVSTFYGFAPRTVARAMAGAWQTASPDQVVDARLRGAGRALRRLCGDLLDATDLREAVDLARTAAGACPPEGRPLCAANAALDEPDTLPLQLFHAITQLREFRGDGHVAVLVAEGISGLESLVMHVAQGDAWTREPLRKRRGWTTEQWDAACAGLQERGWLDGEQAFTERGAVAREHVERRTDVLALAPWQALGEDRCARLRALVRPLSKAVVEAGGIGIR
jgi:hypothetical protein